ncbi:MAG TPA: hypothetical protein VMR97_08915 [Acidimicrobiales bacterium]|nr:hypothetical protein [Acidimicrobiales bacterium]
MAFVKDVVKRVTSEDLRYRVDRWLIDGTLRDQLVRKRYPLMVTSETELVIEGFPRSANTYAFTAFWVSNGRDFPVAKPNHSARNVLVGVRRAVPVILLVRRPLDSVASQLIYRPALTARSVLSAYIRFHERVLPVVDRVVLAPFDSVVEDFGAVVREVNDRFGTSFVAYEPTAENEDRVRFEIDTWDFVESGMVEIREATVSRPSKERDARKPAAVAQVQAERALLARADVLYDRMLAAARTRVSHPSAD